jgi:hypothetical protein
VRQVTTDTGTPFQSLRTTISKGTGFCPSRPAAMPEAAFEETAFFSRAEHARWAA